MKRTSSEKMEIIRLLLILKMRLLSIRVSTAFLCGLMAILFLGCSKEAPGPVRHVLLISIDTLRPDHLSLYGYERETSPRLDAFFSDAQVFERAYSAEASTAPSVASMLTGLHPQNHGIRLFYQRLADEIPTLADFLGEQGFQTAGVISNFVLTAEAMGLDQRFDHYDDYVDEREGRRLVWERRASRTTSAAIDFIDNYRDPNKRTFLWVHYIDPHTPYGAPDDRPAHYDHEGRLPIELKRVPPSAWLDKESRLDGLAYMDRYDEEIAYPDREVGRLLDVWTAAGLTDDSVIVFTADHGEAMVEGTRYFAHGFDVTEPVNRVPLVVRRPGVQGHKYTNPVSNVDIVPSILAWAGLPAAARTDGLALGTRSANDPISLEATTRSMQIRAAIAGDRKWIVERDRTGKETRRRHAVIPKRGAPRSEEGWPEGPGRDALLEWISEDGYPKDVAIRANPGKAIRAPKVAPGRTDEQIEALRALGYVE